MARVVTVRQPETVVVTAQVPEPMVVTHYVGAPGRDGVDGDPLRTTGWRRIEGITTPEGGTATIDLRRDGNQVLIRVTMEGQWAAGSAQGSIMMYDGFNPDVEYHDNRYAGGVPILTNIGNGLPTHRGWVGLLAHPTSRRVWINTTTAHGRLCNAIIQYPTADPWPETLPGTPV